MKISLTVILLLFCSLTFGQEQITSFEKLINYLNEGGQVRVVFHYAKCQLISDNKIEENAPDATGGMNLDTYEYFAKGSIRNKKAFLVSSTSHLIENPLGNGYVYNYVKLKIFDDGQVRIIARYLDPQTKKENMDESFYTEMNDGFNDGGAFFYLMD